MKGKPGGRAAPGCEAAPSWTKRRRRGEIQRQGKKNLNGRQHKLSGSFVVYAVRIPERWYRLQYDIYGYNHQVFHCIVIYTSLIYMFGLPSAFSFIIKHPRNRRDHTAKTRVDQIDQDRRHWRSSNNWFCGWASEEEKISLQAMPRYVKTLQPDGNANSFKAVWMYRKRKRILEVHDSWW